MNPKKKILLGGLLLGAILLASLYYSTFGDLPEEGERQIQPGW
jgi:hypothetical protein